MTYFFELIAKKIGLSRIGRLLLSQTSKNYKGTPIIAIPLDNLLMKQLNYIKEFENHTLFLVSEERFLKSEFLNTRFKETGFIFYHHRFQPRT